MTPKEFSDALGMTESEGNPRAWGDDTGGSRPPLAMGRFQVHPCWLWDQTTDDAAKPGELESWDTWIERLVQRFFMRHAGYLPPVEIAMWFHVGHRCAFGEQGWDGTYAARFMRAALRPA